MKTTAMFESLSMQNKCSVQRILLKFKLYQQNEKPTQINKRNHGREALGELQQWERKEMGQCNYINHRVFTLRCISKGLVPVSIRLNSNRKDISIGVRSIIRRAERQLLQQRVRDINRVLQDNREGIVSSKSRLISLVTNPSIQQFINKVREVRLNMVKQRQTGKFISLFNKSKERDNSS